jgi:branched-chain amino acid transport system substrate-binding protein
MKRREILKTGAVGGVTALVSALSPSIGWAQAQPYRIGLMLPSSGAFAVVGSAINNGFRLALAEYGGKLGGRPVEIFAIDDESDPAKAADYANRLVKRDKVDVLIWSVHSGVALSMAKVARDTKTLLIVPNAGADELTGSLCAPNIFRTSFSNWQQSFATGKMVAERKHRNVVTLAWKYLAGEQHVKAFKEGFESSGGKIVKELYLPFPNVEFQAYLTEIAGIKPDAVYAFTPGAGAVKLVKDYAASGLKQTIPLYGSGVMTDGLLDAMGESANGMLTALQYADGLDNPKNNAFRQAYRAAYKGQQPDAFAVQGYDTAQLLQAGLTATRGDSGNQTALQQAMEAAKVDSPRGAFTMSKSHNPIQDFYVRQVKDGENRYVSVVVKSLADPANGCRI